MLAAIFGVVPTILVTGVWTNKNLMVSVLTFEGKNSSFYINDGFQDSANSKVSIPIKMFFL